MDSVNLDQRLTKIENLLLEQKTVLNFNEVAEYTGLSKSYLYKLTSTGGIPCYKPTGKKIYFKKDEIDQWLLTNKKLSSDEIDEKAENYILGGGQ
ncbi:helix-turn-helix transcriptional regulator [Halalkalibaculum sp. DA3122]|uniref:helix-turn-helix transcriptional regulator n=1 Tax=Halalkalibaculum sp. DA3122 TaxID=3373607 RepID=UPI0037549FDB